GCLHKPSMINAVAVFMPAPRPTPEPSDVGVLTSPCGIASSGPRGWWSLLMKSMNDVFNEAVDYGAEGVVPVGTPIGVERLSHVHRVFNAIMGGGLGFAVEILASDEFRRAVEGCRYLAPHDPAPVQGQPR
ncbi:hypothetical protein, partial [Micromonospora chalcea]